MHLAMRTSHTHRAVRFLPLRATTCAKAKPAPATDKTTTQKTTKTV